MSAIEGYSNKDLLKKVNEAIVAITTTGQSYTIGSRSLTRANLTELRNMKKDLEAQIAAEANDSPLFGGCCVAFFEGK
ncbi:MAG: DUF6148 family protein [Acutalibacteraceae bacterium]|nr:DUF6148 family protein [Acutalibacteraceae bacterium]